MEITFLKGVDFTWSAFSSVSQSELEQHMQYTMLQRWARRILRDAFFYPAKVEHRHLGKTVGARCDEGPAMASLPTYHTIP